MDPKSNQQKQKQKSWKSAVAKFLRLIRKRSVEITVICMVLTFLFTTLGPYIQAIVIQAFAPPPAPKSIGGKPLNFVPQVKRTGEKSWGGLVVMPGEGGRILYGLRIENTGSRTITGLVARISIPGIVSMVPGRCHFGLNQPAAVDCPGSIVSDGVQLPDLATGEWVHVVCMAEMPADVPGGHYSTALKVISDETEEDAGTVKIEVPSTGAEKAVRGLFATAEHEREMWGGEPEMALNSESLLIARWPEFTLEHAHSFVQTRGGPTVALEDLSYDHTLGGQVVELQAEVVSRPREYPAGQGMVKQSIELGLSGSGTRLLCYLPRPRDHLVEEGDELEVKTVLVAWGPQSSRETDELTLGVCPAATVLASEARPLSHPPR